MILAAVGTRPGLTGPQREGVRRAPDSSRARRRTPGEIRGGPRRLGRPVWVVWPDGSVTKEGR